MNVSISDKIVLISSEYKIYTLLFDKNNTLKDSSSILKSDRDTLIAHIDLWSNLAVSKKILISDNEAFTTVPSTISKNEALEIAGLCLSENSSLNLITNESEIHIVEADIDNVISDISKKINALQVKSLVQIWAEECVYKTQSKTFLGVWVKKTHAYFCVIIQSKIVLLNSYPIENISDIMYFMLLQIEEFNLDFNHLKIEIFGAGVVDKYQEFLNPYFDQIEFTNHEVLNFQNDQLEFPKWMVNNVL